MGPARQVGGRQLALVSCPAWLLTIPWRDALPAGCAVLLQVDCSSGAAPGPEAVPAAAQAPVEGGAGVHGGRLRDSSKGGHHRVMQLCVCAAVCLLCSCMECSTHVVVGSWWCLYHVEFEGVLTAVVGAAWGLSGHPVWGPSGRPLSFLCPGRVTAPTASLGLHTAPGASS